MDLNSHPHTCIASAFPPSYVSISLLLLKQGISMQPKLAWNSRQHSCHILPRVGVIDMSHYVQNLHIKHGGPRILYAGALVTAKHTDSLFTYAL